MYKDKDKQREAQRDWVRQKRIDRKGSTEQGSTKGMTEAQSRPEPIRVSKRGKDIKCFADLPADVRETINRLSDTNEEKAKRIAAAIKYQHSTGVA